MEIGPLGGKLMGQKPKFISVEVSAASEVWVGQNVTEVQLVE